MDQLVKLVQDKTGIPQQQAQTAVNTVINYLKDKLPPQISGQLDAVLAGKDVSSIGKDLGGLFGGKKAG